MSASPQRPPLRERLVLTSRDLEILHAANDHRFIRTDHLHQLFFGGRSLRGAQFRLQKLRQHGYLDRVHLASVWDGIRRPPRGAGIPIYKLGALGAQVLRGEAETIASREATSPATIQHHLVVTDFLVSLDVALRGRADLVLAESLHEWDLWERLAAQKVTTLDRRVVPDGAATIVHSETGERQTFYLEVVRAGVKSGNATLWEKMRRYAELNHKGAFKDLYGHARIRAVLIATTSEARAEHLRELARTLPHGRQLFAFAAYEAPDSEGRLTPQLTPDRVLTMDWRTADGDRIVLGATTPM